MADDREEHLLRTSEIYRRLRAHSAPERSVPPVELARDTGPPDSARAMAPPEAEAPPPGPVFWQRMLTRKPDLREIVLLIVVAAALIASRV
ncbi:MAG: hypothetical protein DI533_05195 [Cereibacter sphaeroides]|uniref:Uncharacterized protein n=1 Tax=Cereibacter sphaeroides TaxID=1063 RepID=A0A2W5TVC6_CERSP|nr:MAG: hypothetical protein DI533_05195 [Cereibacter sphaeroides]